MPANRMLDQRSRRIRSLRATELLAIALIAVVSWSCNRGITPGVLRFAHFWAEPSQRAAMDSLLQSFRKEHPEIPVEVTELSWSDGKTKLMIGFNSETAPDVIELGSDWVPQFSSSSVLLDLGTDTALVSRFNNAPQYSWESGMWKGKYFAVPWLLDTRVMFVNDSLAKLAGYDSGNVLKDWASMAALCTKIQSVTQAKGCGINGADQHRLYKKFLPYVWSNGGELFDANGNPTMDRPENIAALRYYVDQQKFGMVELQKNLDDAFKRGTLGVWFSGSWMLGPLQKAPFKWHTEPVPGSAGHVGESFAGGEYLAINGKSAMKHEAMVFLEYITNRTNELSFAKTVNMYPADTTAQHDAFYLNRREGPIFTAQMAHARMTPVIPQWLDVEAIIEDEVSKALYNRSTPEAAMKSAQARITALLKEP